MNYQDKYIGLWHGRKAWYVSKPLSVKKLKAIPDKMRLILRYNKYYESGTNRPKFIIAFVNADDATSFVEDTSEVDFSKKLFVPVDTAVDIARGLLRDMEYGYSIDDLLFEAESFMVNNSKEIYVPDNKEAD